MSAALQRVATKPERYAFDLDLMGGGHTLADVRSRQMVEALAAARAEGQSAGYRQGQSGAEAQAAALAASAVAGLAEALRAFLKTADREFERMRRDASALALAAARQLASALVAREPEGETMALVEACLRHLDGAPHLVLRVHEGDIEAVRPRFSRLAEETGFAGRLTLLGEANVAPGDCRIEWADGGVVRDAAKAEAAMAAVLRQRFAVVFEEEAAQPTDRP
ncbi:MAG: FliH/SctL family protein [Bauldia sp.]